MVGSAGCKWVKAIAGVAHGIQFPEKGKTVTVIIPFAAGGGADVQIRIMGPELEKALGIPMNMVNKTGAASQVGITELAKSKADGYTMGATNTPSGFMPYLDPERGSQYARKDLQRGRGPERHRGQGR